MSIPSLQGDVSKSVLVVTAGAADYDPLLHYVRHSLYDAGFIVVRQERRFLNPELSARLCVQLDYVPPYYGGDTTAATAAAPDAPELLVGNCCVFAVARAECHPRLQALVAELTTRDEEFLSLVSEARAAAAANNMSSGNNNNNNAGSTAVGAPPSEGAGGWRPPLWVSRTPAAAPQAVRTLFPAMLALAVPSATAGREYTQERLKAALLPALTALSAARPENPIEWLAHRLLDTNVEAPPMIRQE